jgi:hypothetical protein
MTLRILNTQPVLVLRGDIHPPDITTLTHVPLVTLMHMNATHAADARHLLDDVPDHILSARLIACLDISHPTLVLLSPSAHAITTTTCLDGCITILPTRIPSFTHIARTRPLPPHEQQRRESLLQHPLLTQCIELATLHGSVSRTLIAQHLQMSTTSAAALLKSLTPLFYPTDTTAKHFVYDIVAHRAVMSYHDEATLTQVNDDPRQQLPEIVRRYANHHGKINQLPVRMNDREIVLRYIAHQLPITPMTEPQINAAILVHVAFDDYATTRRDMVDLGFVLRTADGRMYQRIVDISN